MARRRDRPSPAHPAATKTRRTGTPGDGAGPVPVLGSAVVPLVVEPPVPVAPVSVPPAGAGLIR